MKKTWTPKPQKPASFWKAKNPSHFCAHPGCDFRINSPVYGKRACPEHPLAAEKAQMIEASRPLAALIEETPEETDARLSTTPETCPCNDQPAPCPVCRAVFDANRLVIA